MEYEIEVASLNGVYPEKSNAIVISVEVESNEDFSHSIFSGMCDTKENQNNRLELIKHMMSSFLDGVDTKNREDFFEHIQEMIEDERHSKIEDRRLERLLNPTTC